MLGLTPSSIWLRVATVDEKSGKIISRVEREPGGKEAIRKVFERALKKAQKAQLPRVVFEDRERIVTVAGPVREVVRQVPKPVLPSKSWWTQAHYWINGVGLSYLVSVVIVYFVWTREQLGLAISCIAYRVSAACGFGELISSYLSVGTILFPIVAIGLIIEWPTYRQWTQDKRRRDLGCRKLPHVDAWVKGDMWREEQGPDGVWYMTDLPEGARADILSPKHNPL